MFVTSLKWKLDRESIGGTPRTQGVIGLWDEGELVYIAATARERSLPELLAELLQQRERGVIHATHFTWEITITPRSWAGELLRLYVANHGCLPRYNAPSAPLRHEPEAKARTA